jgi:uncharacterized protein (UPF0335 family)
MINMMQLIRRRRINEAEDVPMDMAAQEPKEYLDSKSIIQRINSIVTEIDALDQEISDALDTAEAETQDVKYSTLKSVISRYLSASKKNLLRLKQPLKKL